MQGIVGSGIAFAAMSWCIQSRGPLFVSMFSPLMLVVVAIVGWAILEEKIHVGRYVCTDNPRPPLCCTVDHLFLFSFTLFAKVTLQL